MQIVLIGAAIAIGLIAMLYIALAVGSLVGAVKSGDTARFFTIRRNRKVPKCLLP